jgi:hypothetical protein
MAVAADPQAVLDAIKDSEDLPLAAELLTPADPLAVVEAQPSSPQQT